MSAQELNYGQQPIYPDFNTVNQQAQNTWLNTYGNGTYIQPQQSTLGTMATGNSNYVSQAANVAVPLSSRVNTAYDISNGTWQQPYSKEVERGLKMQNDAFEKYQNSFVGQAQPYIQGAASLASIGGSLADIYLGFQKMDIAKQQLGMAKEQWAEQKKELAHVRGVRKRLNASYMA